MSSLTDEEYDDRWSPPLLYTPELNDEPECRWLPPPAVSGTVGGDTFTAAVGFPRPLIPPILSRERQLPPKVLMVVGLTPLLLPRILTPLLAVEAALREEAVEEAEEEEWGEVQWALQGRRDGWKQNRRRSSAEVAAECRSVKERERPVPLYSEHFPRDDLSNDALPRDDLPRTDISRSSSRRSLSSKPGRTKGAPAREALSSATRAAASSPAAHMRDSSLRARLRSK